MPHWYWEKKELRLTPSQKAGQLDYEAEMRQRRDGASFCMELGTELNLSYLTKASAAVYFHRFYMFHNFKDFPKYVVATCCIFLAGKAEETPKKCRDLIRTVRALTNDDQFATFGVDPREEVMVTERVLLQTLKFDLQIDHPYSSLTKYARCLKGDQAKLQKMVQMSWTFVNDSLRTTLCLQWEAEVIAIALMYLAAKLSKFEVKDWKNRKESHRHWWDQYVEDLDVDILEDICHQVLDLYSQPLKPTRDMTESASPPSSASSSASQQNAAPDPHASNNGHAQHKTTPPPPPPSNPSSRPHSPPAAAVRPRTPPILTPAAGAPPHPSYQQQQQQQQMQQQQQYRAPASAHPPPPPPPSHLGANYLHHPSGYYPPPPPAGPGHHQPPGQHYRSAPPPPPNSTGPHAGYNYGLPPPPPPNAAAGAAAIPPAPQAGYYPPPPPPPPSSARNYQHLVQGGGGRY